MRPYASRITVADSYLQAIGQVIYNYSATQWNVVYLGSLVVPSFDQICNLDHIGSIARDFRLLSGTEKFQEFTDITARFTSLTTQYLDLLHTTPFTATDAEQLLGSSEAGNRQWTEQDVWKLAEDLQALDIESNALFYKLKG